MSKFNLDVDFRVGANDLLQVWRSGRFENAFDELAASVEHVAFYLRSEQAEGIKRPKAWLLRQLHNGYYPPPAGFVSREQQIVEAKLAAAQEKLRQLQRLEKQLFETEFQAWILELGDDGTQEALKSTLFARDPHSQGARVTLRQRFADEMGRRDPVSEREETNAA